MAHDRRSARLAGSPPGCANPRRCRHRRRIIAWATVLPWAVRRDQQVVGGGRDAVDALHEAGAAMRCHCGTPQGRHRCDGGMPCPRLRCHLEPPAVQGGDPHWIQHEVPVQLVDVPAKHCLKRLHHLQRLIVLRRAWPRRTGHKLKSRAEHREVAVLRCRGRPLGEHVKLLVGGVQCTLVLMREADRRPLHDGHEQGLGGARIPPRFHPLLLAPSYPPPAIPPAPHHPPWVVPTAPGHHLAIARPDHHPRPTSPAHAAHAHIAY